MNSAPFTIAVDQFLAAPKTLSGQLKFLPASKPPDQDGYWDILVAGLLSPHRVKISARLGAPVHRFCILILFRWMDEFVPVVRLNVDPDDQEHINRPPRPPGAPATARGCRHYPWRLNRGTFMPPKQHLPFAQNLSPENHPFHAAILYQLADANITLGGVKLPEYPTREGLFG